jgi:hypothetical protein
MAAQLESAAQYDFFYSLLMHSLSDSLVCDARHLHVAAVGISIIRTRL